MLVWPTLAGCATPRKLYDLRTMMHKKMKKKPAKMNKMPASLRKKLSKKSTKKKAGKKMGGYGR